MESFVKEEDYDEENTSHFEVITNVKKQKFTNSTLHPLIANFKFPKGMTLFQLVIHWLIRNINENILRFQHLCSNFIKHEKNAARRYNCMKELMNYIEGK